MKFFVDKDGKYIGGFHGEAKGMDIELETNNIQVPFPPMHPSQRWDGQKWGAPEYTYQEKRCGAVGGICYETIQNQLDMIYHDKRNGTTTWEDHVALVKDTHRKVF